MDAYYRMGRGQEILLQETLGWRVSARHDFCLAQRVRFRGISAIVTGIHYGTVGWELVRTYELRREKGVLCAPKKNPGIFGMSIPATVMERSGNCVRVHFHIDPEYNSSPNMKYFPYAIEATDFLLASVPSTLRLERSYHSTGIRDSVLGRGWRFPYASRIYRDTMEEIEDIFSKLYGRCEKEFYYKQE